MHVEPIRFQGARRALELLRGCSELFGLLVEAGVVPEPRDLVTGDEELARAPRRPVRSRDPFCDDGPGEPCYSTARVLVHARASSR